MANTDGAAAAAADIYIKVEEPILSVADGVISIGVLAAALLMKGIENEMIVKDRESRDDALFVMSGCVVLLSLITVYLFFFRFWRLWHRGYMTWSDALNFIAISLIIVGGGGAYDHYVLGHSYPQAGAVLRGCAIAAFLLNCFASILRMLKN